MTAIAQSPSPRDTPASETLLQPQPQLQPSVASIPNSGPAGPWSCFNCRQRKIKCDKGLPCTRCSRLGTECTYPTSGRLPRRTTWVKKQGPPVEKKQAELLTRLRRLEGVVTELTTQLEDEKSKPGRAPRKTQHHEPVLEGAIAPADSLEDEVETTIGELGELMIEKDGSVYFNDRFWSVFFDEVKQIGEAAGYDEVDSDPAYHFPMNALPSTTQTASVQSLIFKHGVRGPRIEELFPTPSQMWFLWEMFVENVDSILKVLHVPSINKILDDSGCQPTALGPAMTAVLLAVCYAAAASLSDNEVQLVKGFNATRTELLARFRLGTEMALAQADFLSTSDIVVVQAFTIYLTVVDHCDTSRAVWSLMGTLQRLAVHIGLHQDGANFPSIGPFQAEMRRRLWWQILLLDSKSGQVEVSQLSIPETMFDTKLPANLDDTDLYPEMAILPPPKTGFTATMTCRMRCEKWKILRRAQSWILPNGHIRKGDDDNLSPQEKLAVFREAKETIETQYMPYFNPSIPLHAFGIIVTRFFMAKWEMIVNYVFARASGPAFRVLEDRFFATSVATVDHMYAMIEGDQAARCGWMMRGYELWHAIGIILIQLCARPWSSDCEDARLLVSKAFRRVPDRFAVSPIRKTLRALMSRVVARRQKQMALLAQEAEKDITQGQGQVPVPRPEPIPSQAVAETVLSTLGGDAVSVTTAPTATSWEMPAVPDSSSSMSVDHSPNPTGFHSPSELASMPAVAELGTETFPVAQPSMANLFTAASSFEGMAVENQGQGETGIAGPTCNALPSWMRPAFSDIGAVDMENFLGPGEGQTWDDMLSMFWDM